jgi:phospholipid/cholesterol/gamma-HCH transport system ATP-binding protein
MMSAAMSLRHPIIEIQNLRNYLGHQWVQNGLDLTVNKSEIIGIIGPSGVGKTTLLRSILMLQKPTAGSIKVFDIDVVHCDEATALAVQRRWGVMFQSGALFSALTVLENVMFPLHEYTHLSLKMQEEIALLKIAFAGLEISAASKYPAELSGGMQKRAALARAIALDPELVFLDEPTAGLDPKSADDMDNLVLHLRDSLGLTFVMVTHDLDTLWRVPDRIVFLGEGKVLAVMPMAELVKQPHPLIKSYFSGARSADRGRLITGAQDGY